MKTMSHVLIAFAVVGLALAPYPLAQAETAPLELEAKIPLGDVQGRIDHLALDIQRQRLYVAELENNSVGIVDLKKRKTIRTVAGFAEPQGIAYQPSNGTLYVANGGDGSLRLFAGTDFKPIGKIDLGGDADNVRVDSATQQVIVGYGRGALAVIDATTRKRIADVPLKGHPEGFQLEASGQRIIVNIPDTHEIAVIDRRTQKQIASWPTNELAANFPLAIDTAKQRALVVFRKPAMLGVFSLKDGNKVATIDTCGDADDIFVDAKRHRVYITCGEGFIDVLAEKGESYVSEARLKTSAGTRTALFVPELNRLYVAVRATTDEPAAIWVYRTTP